MKRRKFITLLGGAAATPSLLWPLTARTQPAKLPTIGFLGASTPAGWRQEVAAFAQRLRELGWIEGRTAAIEYRWAEGRNERFAEIAAEFVRFKVDVIVTAGSAVPAVKQATSVIPIVFAVANDPVGAGLVASLSRPGGNVTGLSIQAPDLTGKRLEVLREVLPDLRRLAIMANAGYPAAVLEMGEAAAAARALGLDVTRSEIRRGEDIAPAIAALKGRADALYACGRRPRQRQPRSHQHLGAGSTTAHDLREPLVSRVGWFHVLWAQQRGAVPACRRLCRQDSARGKAG
jgi:putative tryptophan/tyrosine transport system substrate-binding protein